MRAPGVTFMTGPTWNDRPCKLPFLGAVLAALLVPVCAAQAAAPAHSPDDIRFFEEKVRPVLQAHCVKCHGGEKTKAGLRLTSRDALLKGGDTGPAAVAGQAHKSLLLEAVGYKNDKLQMPPSGKLPQADLDALAKWVEMGLPWTAGDDAAHAAESTPPHAGPPKVDDAARSFWSFRPVARPGVPAVKEAAWVKNPVDAFILSKLEAKGFAPAPPAGKVTLIRRATYDLTGLPPTIAEVDAFVADSSPDAYEKLIDRLLASPRYGEKWGRHWLDLVRFAETNSYERDSKKPSTWRYRDYVIRSFNDDKPYDRFLKEQLAGDEMPDAGPSNPDPIIATGFYRLGVWDDDPADDVQHRYDVLDDLVATVGQTFLGMTIDCARCHDHKIEPIPQRDYYRLLAFFQNVNDYRNGGPGDEFTLPDSPANAGAVKEREQQIEQLETETKDTEEVFLQLLSGEPGRQGLTLDDARKLIRAEGLRVLGQDRFASYGAKRKKLRELQRSSATPTALCVSERGPTPPDTFVMIRGSAHSPGDKVEPGFLEVITPGDAVVPSPAPGAKSSGRRTVLADWIASERNPLTARVMVNRIWQYHFGRGIVRSSSNFGFQGDAPTHPELLEWLASEFVAPALSERSESKGVSKAWSMKHMHRLLMTSSVYRMSSKPNEQALAADPRNDLMWRFDMRRLTAEEIRDSVLAANGTLNLAMYGPSVFPPIPRAVMQGQSRPGEGWGRATPEDAARRSVYVHVKRSLRVPILEAFDGAETDKSCPVRFVTVQPTQALGMLNGEFLNDEAKKLADRVKREAGDDVTNQIALAFRLMTSGEPAEKDVAAGVELFKGLTENDGAQPDQAMQYVCLVMLNLNEFVYLD